MDAHVARTRASAPAWVLRAYWKSAQALWNSSWSSCASVRTTRRLNASPITRAFARGFCKRHHVVAAALRRAMESGWVRSRRRRTRARAPCPCGPPLMIRVRRGTGDRCAAAPGTFCDGNGRNTLLRLHPLSALAAGHLVTREGLKSRRNTVPLDNPCSRVRES